MIHNPENIDYLAEVVVSHIFANKGIDDSSLYVDFLGIFRRFFSREIENIEVRRNSEGEREWNISVHREGMYDLLPEGFFHSSPYKLIKDLKETKEEFRFRREKEKQARLFFKPLEQEFFRLSVYKEIFEQNFFYSPETIQEFIDFFDLDTLELTWYQKASLFFLFPHISKIAGNPGLLETCFHIILQERVRIEVGRESASLDFDPVYSSLGSNVLGQNTLLGKTCQINIPVISILIGPLSDSNSLISYISGRKFSVISRLRELFIQADLPVNFHILLDDKDSDLILDSTLYKGRLNYSAQL